MIKRRHTTSQLTPSPAFKRYFSLLSDVFVLTNIKGTGFPSGASNTPAISHGESKLSSAITDYEIFAEGAGTLCVFACMYSYGCYNTPALHSITRATGQDNNNHLYYTAFQALQTVIHTHTQKKEYTTIISHILLLASFSLQIKESKEEKKFDSFLSRGTGIRPV